MMRNRTNSDGAVVISKPEDSSRYFRLTLTLDHSELIRFVADEAPQICLYVEQFFYIPPRWYCRLLAIDSGRVCLSYRLAKTSNVRIGRMAS